MNNPDASAGAKRIKILLLDEDDDFSNLMRSYFKRKEMEVYVANNACGALELVRKAMPDYMFTSIRLVSNWPDEWKEMKAAAPQMKVRFHEQAGNGKLFSEGLK